MRLCRFGDNRLGLVDGTSVRDVTAALDVLPRAQYPFPRHDALIAHLDAVKTRVATLAPGAAVLPLHGLRLLSPVANPGKIVAAPVNYQKHLDEVRDDVAIHQNNTALTLTIQSAGVFLKASSALVGPGEGVEIRRTDRRTDHEVELVFVIGKTASRVSKADALQYVAGYAVGLDITIRGSEDRSFRKSPDGYAVLGPWLVTADEVRDPGILDLELSVNGELRQRSNTKHLILGVSELIEMASAMYTLYPGDLIYTGTPEGVSPIEPGDRIAATVQSIGTLNVIVRGAPSTAEASTGAPAAAHG